MRLERCPPRPGDRGFQLSRLAFPPISLSRMYATGLEAAGQELGNISSEAEDGNGLFLPAAIRPG